MKHIQTRYKGYHFRSRLEARWAVYFDAIGWKWLYEPEGFALGDGDFYLPDFLLPECGLWVEVKAERPDENELRKAKKLAAQSNISVVFATGLPDAHELSMGLGGFYASAGEEEYVDNLASLDSYCFSKWRRAGWVLYADPCESDFAACAAARSARFEHGESGAT